MTDTTTITLTHEGKTYTAEDERGGWHPCEGCSFYAGPVKCDLPRAHPDKSACSREDIIWIEQPQKESPLDMPGSIASVPQSLEEVRSSDDWVKLGGGVMPVTGMVEVRYRNGVTNTDDSDSFLWDHRDCADDIVAYRIAIPAPQYDPRDVSFSPLDRQVGGSHYRDMAIQPVEFIVANGIPYREANVIKYVVRHASKNGKQDLLKARHYIDMLIADYEDAQ